MLLRVMNKKGTARHTYHTAVSLTGSEGSDDQWDVQVRVDPPALIATLQTAYIVLQLALVQLVNQVSLAGEGYIGRVV